jgi:hypothetical protein
VARLNGWQRGGVVGNVLAGLFLLVVAMCTISTITTDYANRERQELEQQARAAAERSNQLRDDAAREDFKNNRATIVAAMKASIAKHDWNDANAWNEKYRAVVTDAEWNELGAKVTKRRLAAEAADRVAAEKANRARRKREGVRIGMSQQEVLMSSWGRPENINRTTTASRTHEQWVYPGNQYLYFDDGRLTAIQNTR